MIFTPLTNVFFKLSNRILTLYLINFWLDECLLSSDVQSHPRFDWSISYVLTYYNNAHEWIHCPYRSSVALTERRTVDHIIKICQYQNGNIAYNIIDFNFYLYIHISMLCNLLEKFLRAFMASCGVVSYFLTGSGLLVWIW